MPLNEKLDGSFNFKSKKRNDNSTDVKRNLNHSQEPRYNILTKNLGVENDEISKV